MMNNFRFHLYAQNSLLITMSFFFIIITLSCDFRVHRHRAGSQLKMSECQIKAGNQEFQSLNVIENLKTLKT